MNQIYFVYVADRGWWARGGTYSSDYKNAMQFTQADAVKFCKNRYNGNLGDISAFPILEDDVLEIIRK